MPLARDSGDGDRWRVKIGNVTLAHWSRTGVPLTVTIGDLLADVN